MGVLAIDDAYSTGPREVQQRLDGRNRRFGVRDEQAAPLLDEVILHVDHDERRPRRLDADLVQNCVLGNVKLHVTDPDRLLVTG